jgi:hypothetical protein
MNSTLIFTHGRHSLFLFARDHQRRSMKEDERATRAIYYHINERYREREAQNSMSSWRTQNSSRLNKLDRGRGDRTEIRETHPLNVQEGWVKKRLNKTKVRTSDQRVKTQETKWITILSLLRFSFQKEKDQTDTHKPNQETKDIQALALVTPLTRLFCDTCVSESRIRFLGMTNTVFGLLCWHEIAWRSASYPSKIVWFFGKVFQNDSFPALSVWTEFLFCERICLYWSVSQTFFFFLFSVKSLTINIPWFSSFSVFCLSFKDPCFGVSVKHCTLKVSQSFPSLSGQLAFIFRLQVSSSFSPCILWWGLLNSVDSTGIPCTVNTVSFCCWNEMRRRGAFTIEFSKGSLSCCLSSQFTRKQQQG